MSVFVNNTTFVTAYYDIGRGDEDKWTGFVRSSDTYFGYFENVKKINCNLVVYCDESDRERMEKCIGSRAATKIITRPFNQLDFYLKFFERTKALMESDDYRKRVARNSPTPQVPEYNHPSYNIVNFNKIAFVKEAMDYFESDYYGWIDFGFGHNKDYVKYTIDETFGHRVTQGSKVYMRCFRRPRQEQLFNHAEYWHNDPSIQGSSFLGTKASIIKFYSLMEQSLDTSISMGCIDDDQTQYTMTYLLDPNNFNLHQGNWFTHFC